ncbi:MAG TPA: methylenetetrahydrofolate reductase [Anaerohalosphaeraceae bacterium]|nr:methylenetetrahydrofolate reductase [Anaerohalosphaeraceae bacterium]
MTESKRLKEVLDSGQFAVLAELTGGPGFNFGPIEKFLFDHQQNKKPLPEGFCFAGIALPQNPGGVANIDPADVLAAVTGKNLLGQLDCIPHVSCKDSNSDGLISTLAGYRQQGIQSILALTGDKPASAKKVFELESIGLLSLIKRLNRQAMLAAKPGQWNSVHQFYAGAAVSPYKYTEPSLMQQYYKMEKKIAAGAEFLITQVGWDWKKTLELTLILRTTGLRSLLSAMHTG